MKVLLIVPTFQYRSGYPVFLSITDFPAGWAYLASALKAAGHEVFGLNLNNAPGFANQREMIETKITHAIDSIHPDLVGTGGLCTDYAFLRDALQIVRKRAPQTPIVLGGGIVNNDAEFALQALKPDFCVRGEGEEILVQLAANLNGGARRYADIPNLGFWENGNPQFTKQDFSYGDINLRAFPDFEVFGVKEMMDHYWPAARNLYRYPRFQPRPWPIVAARSCPFSCSFCVHHRGVKYRARSMENIMAEIGHFYAKYQFNVLLLLDELFAINKDRLRQFSEALLKQKEENGMDISWTFQTHASASFDDETLALAKQAGCYFFGYGMESASPTVLASMNKRSKPVQIANAIQTADKLRLGFGGNFIFGDPAENSGTLTETFSFFRQYCTNIHVDLFSIRPYPGSRLFDTCVSKGLIGDKLAFYETIDENPINMTSVPNRYWTIWVLALDYLGGLFLWVKSTKATSRERLNSAPENPMARHYGMEFYKIGAVCPHCNQTVHLQEMMAPEGAAHAFAITRAKSGLIAWLWSCRKKAWFFYSCYVSALLASLVFKPFRLLLYLKNGEQFAPSKIMTGCPHCNKRFRVQT